MNPSDDLEGLDLEELERRYTPEPIPPCPVCGSALSIQRAGGGEATVYACPKAMITDEGHYERSRFTHLRPGDPRILRLISSVRKKEVDREEVARRVHAILSPHQSWEDYDSRRQEWRGGELHPSQETAFEIVDAVLSFNTPVVSGGGVSNASPESSGVALRSGGADAKLQGGER